MLISGAGIAGPALAYWLSRRGLQVTIVERARDSITSGRRARLKIDNMAKHGAPSGQTVTPLGEYSDNSGSDATTARSPRGGLPL